MGNAVRFAASGKGPSWAGRVTKLDDEARRPDPIAAAKAAAQRGNALILARRDRNRKRVIRPLTLVEAARAGVQLSVPMPSETVTLVCEPGAVLTGRDENGEPTYKVEAGLVRGQTPNMLGRRWLRHPRTSNTQVYVPTPFERRDNLGRKVKEHRGSHRVGNVPSDLVPSHLKGIAALMRPDH